MNKALHFSNRCVLHFSSGDHIRDCDATELGGSCGVTDGCTEADCQTDPCDGCEYLEGPGEGGAYWPDGMSGPDHYYWSSSPVADDGSIPSAWLVDFLYVYSSSVFTSYSARCVR